MFIGSSTGGLPVAEALQVNLDSFMEVHLWNQGTFGLTQVTIEALVNAGTFFDFAILVFTPDDQLTCGDQQWFAPRDNVVLEFGFFLGCLGRRRTFIVSEKHERLKLPSDINGVTFAQYQRVGDHPSPAALGAACTKIKKAIEIELEARQAEEEVRASITKAEEQMRQNLKKSEASARQEKAKKFIHDGLQVVCRALARSSTPEEVKLRAFIFTKVDNDLICSNFWAPRPVKEAIGLRFGMNPESEKQVAVVRAAMRREVCGVPITFLPEQLNDHDGDIDKDLCFILAAPILSPDGEVLGTVDFDASSKRGEKILRHEISHNVIFELGKLLYLAF